MSQGGQVASLPRFGRRLLAVGLILDGAELVCCGLPLVLWMRNLPWEMLWLKVALPLTLAAWVAAELVMAARLRPLLDLVASIREGGKPKPPEADVARQALARAPREVAVVHLLGWAMVASILPAHAVLSGERDLPSAAALIQLVLLTSTGLVAIRTLALEIILSPTRPMLLPNLQGIRVFADRYRGALLAVGIALLGLWQTALAFFAATVVRASEEVLTSGMFALWPVLILGAYAWWRLLLKRTRPIEEYFDLALRTKGSKGPSREDPKAVAAFVSAQATPYALGMVQAVFFLAATLAAVAYLGARGEVDLVAAGRLLLLATLLSLLATMYQTLLLQSILRPFIRHLGSRHALPLDQVRSPFGLHAKLGGTMVAVLVSACAFVWLVDRANAPCGSAALAVALALILGVVLFLVRDVVAPLRTLEQRSSDMAQGQLARPVPPWGEADEIGRLAIIFEEMRRSLRDRLRSTESINVDLEREVRRRPAARSWPRWGAWWLALPTKSTTRSTPSSIPWARSTRP